MKKLFLSLVILIIILFLTFAISWILYLKKAHSTFDNYYAFRGCVKLVKKTTDYGICRIQSGATIKIVKYQDKWFLDGDLPWGCLGKICFGI
jgi:hypothetical protein